jgi:hypothetical protein
MIINSINENEVQIRASINGQSIPMTERTKRGLEQ